MIARLLAARAWMTALSRTVRVPADGQPLDDDELHDLITVMRSWRDTAGTRRAAPLERRAEKAMRKATR
jgi:hypothetical protein